MKRHSETNSISRRRFVAGAAAAATALLAGCTELRFVLKAYPARYETDADLIDRNLRAFATTVIPVAVADDPNLTRIYKDEYYRFAEHCAFFVHDLDLGDDRPFLEMDDLERTRFVQDALDGGGLRECLYRAAILLAQASFYGGIYDERCEYIGFLGPKGAIGTLQTSYSNAGLLVARETTADGNHL